MSKQGFWENQDRAQSLVKEMKSISGIAGPFSNLAKDVYDLGELLEIISDTDIKSIEESKGILKRLTDELQSFELQSIFTGKDDSKDVFMSIHAGAGGTDSCDWAQMLLRMYMRWLERNKFKANLIDVLEGDEAGIKRATLTIEGANTFGYLKSEIGVHRLVRISHFDANHRRHTSFASVDIVPQYEDVKIAIDEKELRVDTYRAGGAGGQHVNVTDSAVRITHIPTGIVAQCQNERSQHMNKKMAMKILMSNLYLLKEEERADEFAKMYGEKGEIAWSQQIRSYVLHPYTMVKDHRTNYETGNINAVLDGELNEFIDAFLHWKDRKY